MRGRLLTILSGAGALAALAAVVILATRIEGGDAASPTRAAGPFPGDALTVGIQDDQLTIVPPDLIPTRIERIAASRARFTRVELSWVDVAANRPGEPANPDDPVYRWGRYDAILDGLRVRGIQAIVAIGRAPGWANGGQGPEGMPDLDAYAAFVRAVATRYDGRLHARVPVFEPWDRPNSPTELGPQWRDGRPASPALYADLLRRAYPEIKAASPRALVVGVSAAPIDTSAPPAGAVSLVDFLQGLAGSPPPMDAVAIQLAPEAAPNAPSNAVPSFATLPRVIDEIDRVVPGVPVLVTRFGYATPPEGPTEADQATYLTQALQRMAATPRIRFASWYSLQDSMERPSGLLRPDGSEKPAWARFREGPKVLPSSAGP